MTIGVVLALPELMFGLSAIDLAYYQKTATFTYPEVASTSFSGLTRIHDSGNLLVVDDADHRLYEITPAGELLHYWTLNGFVDTEGLSWFRDDQFFLVEEGRGTVCLLTLPEPEGTLEYPESVYTLQSNLGNSGIEGVAYSNFHENLFAIREMGPMTLFEIVLDETGYPISHTVQSPFSLEGIHPGDAAGLYVTDSGDFFIVNQEENKLMGYLASGELSGELPLNMEKPEGVTADEATGLIYVTGEAHELAIFAADPTRISHPKGGPHAPALHPALRYISGNGMPFSAYSSEGTEAPGYEGVFNISGKNLRSGNHGWSFQRGLPSGVYFLKSAPDKIGSVPVSENKDQR